MKLLQLRYLKNVADLHQEVNSLWCYYFTRLFENWEIYCVYELLTDNNIVKEVKKKIKF